jgi:structural maintenance of chromosome 4
VSLSATFCHALVLASRVPLLTHFCSHGTRVDQVHLESALSQPFQAPAGTERLYDLVRVKDNMFRTAFYFALRNTLVAPDLDTATKVAYSKQGGGNQVVTVEGQLIASSGTMSGGGKTVQRGGE